MGVAISPVPIIAVTLMLFSQRVRVNGLLFLLGWAVALALVSGVAYALADQANASTDSTASDTIAWGKIVVGLLFLLLPLATGETARHPAPYRDAEMDGRDRRPKARQSAGVSAFCWPESIRRI